MAAKRKEREITRIRRQEILSAAEELFSEKGFKGATTRDLAAKAGVHEALLFRHFTNKQGLYRAALEAKILRNRNTSVEQMQKCAGNRDDRGFFEALARGLLTRFEDDPSIPRLLLRSALDGHEPQKTVTERQLRVERPTLDYVAKRIREGAFRRMDSSHAVLAFGAMLFGYIVRQQVMGMANHKAYNREKIVKSFVTIFLDGMKTKKG